MAIYTVPTQNALTKTLTAQLLAGATTVSLSNVVGIENAAGTFVVDRVDANDEATASKREYISFTGVSGSTLTGLTRGLAGSTDQDHAVGAIVEFIFDVTQAKAIKDTFETAHNADGTHKSGSVFTLPQINDTSSDHQYVVAVSELAADRTVTLPLLTGNDEFVFKDHTQTLTNKRLTSPKINEDVALTSTATELNALDGQTGAWADWTPTTANITVGSGVITAKYCQIGKTVHFIFKFVLAANSAVGTGPTFTLPATAARVPFSFECMLTDYGSQTYKGWATDSSTSIVAVNTFNVGATYPTVTGVTASVPHTWAVNDVIYAWGTYEAA